MPCPHCRSTTTVHRSKTTQLGYRTFCCQACKRTFNERTGTPFNYLEYPTDIVVRRNRATYNRGWGLYVRYGVDGGGNRAYSNYGGNCLGVTCSK